MGFDEEEAFRKFSSKKIEKEIDMEILKDDIDEISKKVDSIPRYVSNSPSKSKKAKKFQIFIDSADVEEIKKANSWGIIDGVTTNPTLICRTERAFQDCIEEIVSIIDGPISAEVVSLDSESMIKEAKILSKIHENIVIKVPVTTEGLKTIKALTQEGIKTNATLCFSANQAILVAKAGATYVSPFVGRLDDIGHDGMQVVRDIVKIYDNYSFDTKVLVASIRHPIHVIESAKIGADVVTVPFNVLEKMSKHALTDVGIQRFLDDWDKVPKKELKKYFEKKFF
jgi:transaldolase